MFSKFRGTERDHEHQNQKWKDEPRRIVVSAAEWSSFRAACNRIDIEASGENYWHWRLREQPFA